MQDDVADIGFCPVFATLRCRIREIHLHVSSLVPGSTGRRGCRHTKDAAMATPAARAMFLPETKARLFPSLQSHRVGAARRVVDTPFSQIIRTRLFSHDYGQPSSPSAYLILRSLLTFIRLCLTIGSRVDDICGEQ